MTKERIEDMWEVVVPFVKKRLLVTNYEGLGEADAKEFEKEFNEILNLAIKALEQEPKSEWEHDHEILKAYSDSANEALEKIRDEILDNAFSVVNPNNTYEYINVIDLDSIDEILGKYKSDSGDKKWF